jgi:hypothetical protein
VLARRLLGGPLGTRLAWHGPMLRWPLPLLLAEYQGKMLTKAAHCVSSK